MFLKISQNSQEYTCAGVSFLIKLQAKACKFIKKETLTQMFSWEFCEIFKNSLFTEHLWWLFLKLDGRLLHIFFYLKILGRLIKSKTLPLKVETCGRCFLVFHRMIALLLLWIFFISFQKLFSFLRYSHFCILVFPSFSPVRHCFTGWSIINLKVYDVVSCLNKNLITHFISYLEKEKRYDNCQLIEY